MIKYAPMWTGNCYDLYGNGVQGYEARGLLNKRLNSEIRKLRINPYPKESPNEFLGKASPQKL